MQLPQKISDIRAYQKPQDSIFSTLFTRKLSRVFTFYLVRWFKNITPNQVSFASFVLGIGACGLFLLPDYWWRFAGAILLQLSFALDCSDGEVARLKNMGSKFGAWYDSVNDRIKEIAMFSALGYAWYARHPQIYVILITVGAIIGLMLVDYLREAKKSSWPTTRTAELFITKNIYIGSVDVIIYFACFAILFEIEIFILAFFLLISLPLIAKQMLSAWKLGKKE